MSAAGPPARTSDAFDAAARTQPIAKSRRGLITSGRFRKADISVPPRKAPRQLLGQEATVGLLELIDTREMVWSERVLSITVERFERRLAEEIATFRVAIMREIHEVPVDVIRWMFMFWVGQFFAFAGLL